MKTQRLITIPNGRSVTLGAYIRAWRQLKTAAPNTLFSGFAHFPASANDILRSIEFGIHDRINRHLPWFNRGRKWSWEWQSSTANAARWLNTPRLAIHWLPYWLHPRFAHRLITRDS